MLGQQNLNKYGRMFWAQVVSLAKLRLLKKKPINELLLKCVII